MKGSLPFALTIGGLLFTASYVVAQNPVLSGSCTGSPLTVTGSNTSARKIEWVRNSASVEQINFFHLGNPAVIAGVEGQWGGAANQFYHPKRLFVTSSGDIYVADWGNSRVQKWSPPYTTGVTVASGLNWVEDVQVENGNTILVSEHWGKRISRWPGNTTVADIGGGADGMCTDASGRVYVVEFWGGRILRLPANSPPPAPWSVFAGSGTGSGLNQLSFPSDVAVDGNGQIYVLDTDNDRVIRFPSNSSGSTNGTVMATGLGSYYNHSISIDPSGLIFVTTTGSIKVIEPGSGIAHVVADMEASGIQPINNNEVYVTNNQCVKKLSRLAPSNTFTPTVPGTYTARIYYNDGTVKTSNAINVLLSPAAPALTANTPLCPGNTLTLNGSSSTPGATWQWRGPLGFSASAASPSITGVTVAYSGNYIATITDPSGCVSPPDTVAVMIEQPVPSVGIAANTLRYFCPGQPVTFMATPVNGGPTPTYQWKKNGTTVGAGNTFTTAAINDGDVITCIMTSSAACASPLTVTSNAITMSGSPEPLLQAPANCVGTTITMNSPLPLRQMSWYRDGAFVQNAPLLLNGITIAGGNGWGAAANQLRASYSITKDAAGNLYVLDLIGYRVLKFPPNSTSSTNWVVAAGGNGQGTALNQFDSPSALFVDGAGNLYVTDKARILKFPPGSTSATNGVIVAGGSEGSALNQLRYAFDVWVDVAGYIYVYDEYNYRVMKFPPNSTAGTNGVVVAGGNGPGSNLDQFLSATSLCVDNFGNVYVADATYPTRRVVKWAPGATSGVIVGNSDFNQFSYGSTLFTDAAGNLYLNDPTGHRVLKWDPATSTTTIVAGGNGSGSGADQLYNPRDVYVDVDGYVYVLDNGNYRVQKIVPEVVSTFTPTVAGTYKATTTSQGGCAAASNELVISALNTPTISISTPATTICSGTPVTFTATPANAGTAPIYQWKLNGVNADTGTTYTPFAPLANGDVISCELTVDTDAGCVTSNTVMSNTITMTVNATMQITIAADNAGPVCPGATPSYTATATGLATPAYQWQVNGINAGSNSANFSPAVLSNGDVITCILTGTTGCPASNTVTSNAIIPVVYNTNDTILYVNKNVSGGTQSGLDWNNAIAELSDALLLARACNSIKEVWIAGGVYHPQYDVSGNVPADPRAATFSIPPGLRLYGGLHTGYNAALPADVNALHAGNYTIAAADSSYLDGWQPAGNAYHVVSLNNTTAGTLLNGLVIRNGLANGAGMDAYGGGLLVIGGSATISWCTIAHNTATAGGGAYHSNTTALQYAYCSFYGNPATTSGGAVYTTNTIDVSYVNSVFDNNTAILNGGALHTQITTGSIINCTFYKNTAANGTAIYHTTGNTVLSNSIVMGTGTAIVNGPALTILNTGLPALTAANETLWFLSVSPGHPAYLRLTNCAPAVNAGNNASYGPHAATGKDLARNARLQQGLIDQGAYESAGGLITISCQPAPAMVCALADTSFSVQASSTSPLTYQWQVNKNDGNGFTDTAGATNPVLHIVNPGAGRNGWLYRAYIKHCPYAADTTAAVPLTVHAMPAMQSITGNVPLCTGKTTQLSNTTIVSGIVWKSLQPSIATINATGMVQGINAGSATIRFIASTAAGCSDSTAVNITVHPLPVMQPITGVQLLCANSSLQLANATAGVTGVWKSTNPAAATVNAATGRVTAVSGGTTTIRYVATNANGCQDSVETQITVHNLPLLQPIVSATNDLKLCEQATLQLSTNTNAINTYWKTLNNMVATVQASGQVTGIAAGNATVRFTAIGINNTGCNDSMDVVITVLPKLSTTINITAGDREICDGEAVTFTATTANGGTSPVYQWMLNNQPIGSNNRQYSSTSLKDGDMISCVLQSNAVCASPAILPSGIIAMTVHPLPVVLPIASRPAIFKGDQLQLSVGITGAAQHIKWQPGSSLSNDTIAAPLARPVVSTLYTVAAMTQYGCTASGQVNVLVMEKQDIPNAFSPNGDGIHDRWEIKYLDKFPGASVQVFNRYGQLVYTATSYQPGNGWDGKLKGQPLPMGTYYYVIDLKNGLEKMTGSISIIK